MAMSSGICCHLTLVALFEVQKMLATVFVFQPFNIRDSMTTIQ